ncbi:hypothetical protein PROFUN_06291 [Planoprotostelium fungivorum]|uniref:Glutathione S-transferase n=1 Tax=Planoprotostelium fungivorum TaxID=1890364 RepID=A0A2P6NE94_9EUKA|nr:hypothetical protein PROFUN_06291 [Planoprotostelium fungivorum]
MKVNLKNRGLGKCVGDVFSRDLLILSGQLIYSHQTIMTVTLFNLENSRSFRVSWLIHEINAPVEQRYYSRINGKKAVPELSKDSGFSFGKSPCLVVEEEGQEKFIIFESGNCMQYILERYAPDSVLLPGTKDFRGRTAVIGWIDFSESVMLHVLPGIYNQWFSRPEDAAAVDHIAQSLSINIHKDLDLIEDALKEGPYICGKDFTAADIALCFSCELVLLKVVASKGEGRWKRIEEWLKRIEKRPAYLKTRENLKHEYVLNDER